MFFEYFYNHSVIVRMGSFITYTRLYPNLGNYLFIVTTLYRRCPCSNAVNMYLRQLFLGCLDKWAIIYLKPTVLGYLILVLMCILFAPISNHKICLTTKQKWIHKLISVIIVSIGFLLFYKIGNTKMNTTLFYSFFCVIILMIVETIKNLMRHFK